MGEGRGRLRQEDLVYRKMGFHGNTLHLAGLFNGTLNCGAKTNILGGDGHYQFQYDQEVVIRSGDYSFPSLSKKSQDLLMGIQCHIHY